MDDLKLFRRSQESEKSVEVVRMFSRDTEIEFNLDKFVQLSLKQESKFQLRELSYLMGRQCVKLESLDKST